MVLKVMTEVDKENTERKALEMKAGESQTKIK